MSHLLERAPDQTYRAFEILNLGKYEPKKPNILEEIAYRDTWEKGTKWKCKILNAKCKVQNDERRKAEKSDGR